MSPKIINFLILLIVFVRRAEGEVGREEERMVCVGTDSLACGGRGAEVQVVGVIAVILGPGLAMGSCRVPGSC